MLLVGGRFMLSVENSSLLGTLAAEINCKVRFGRLSSVWLILLVSSLVGCGGGGGKASGLGVLTTVSTTTPPPSNPVQPAPPAPAPAPTPPVEQPNPENPPPTEPPLFGPTGSFTSNLGICIGYSIMPETTWDLLADGGYKVVRFDFVWASVEKTPGVYNFAGEQNYDAMVDSLTRRNIKIVFILDYGNPLYDGGYAPYTQQGRDAFARFAAAAVTRYKGKNIVWEIWNEPNEPGFWRMAPGVTEPISSLYGQLVKTVIPAMRTADSKCFIAGPSVSNLSDGDANFGAMQFIRELGRNGTLQQLDAVSVHGYRSGTPESVASDYVFLRAIMGQFNCADKPIYNTEVGRSTGYYPNLTKINSDEQGGWLVRTYLADIASNIGMTVWYTWMDAGNNSSEVAENYGVITKNGQPKQVYAASRTMSTTLDGYRFTERVTGSLPQDVYLYKFLKGTKAAYVLWKTTANPDTVAVPLASGTWTKVDTFGNRTSVNSTGTIQSPVSTLPVYFVPAE